MQRLAQFITKIIDFFYSPFRHLIPQQMFRYAACGGGNMVLDWVLYFFVYNYVIGHQLVIIPVPFLHLPLSSITISPHIAALCIVFPITLLTGFLLNKYITFTQSSIHGSAQLFRYTLVVFVNLAINYFGLHLCVDFLEWYPTPSKMAVTFITIAVSFFCQKYFTFRS